MLLLLKMEVTVLFTGHLWDLGLPLRGDAGPERAVLASTRVWAWSHGLLVPPRNM